MTLRPALLMSCLCLALAACSSSPDQNLPPPTTQSIDLQRYQGTWYELARLPMFFQRNCVQSEAHYRLRDDGRIDVNNRCKENDGQWNDAHGIAEPQVAGKTDKLWVRFDNWFSRLAPEMTKGEYWVLYVDPDYRVALVGHPNREYLWLLSRTPTVSQQTRDQLLELARKQGYPTEQLIWRQPDTP